MTRRGCEASSTEPSTGRGNLPASGDDHHHRCRPARGAPLCLPPFALPDGSQTRYDRSVNLPPRKNRRAAGKARSKNRAPKTPPPPEGTNTTAGSGRLTRRVRMEILVPALLCVGVVIVTVLAVVTGNRSSADNPPDAGLLSRRAGNQTPSSNPQNPSETIEWFGTWYPPILPEREQAILEGRIASLKQRVPPILVLSTVLDNPEARRRIRSAGRAAVEGVWPREIWRGDEVRSVVSELVDGRPVFVHDDATVHVDPKLMGPALTIGFAYHPITDQFSCAEEAILGWSERALRATLVHEATHLVFTREYLALSGLERRELMVLEKGCSDIALALRVLNEAIAYRNEALWHAAQPGEGPADTPRKAMVYAMALAAERRDKAKLVEYVGFLRNYAEAALPPPLRRDAPKRLDCGPPAVLRGKSRGKVVRPSDPAPEILVPFLEALGQKP
jgi:hypothetical protein